MCSKCFKQHHGDAQASTAAAPTAALSNMLHATATNSSGGATAAAVDSPNTGASADSGAAASTPTVEAPGGGSGDAAGDALVQKNKERCFQCRKKVGLLGFTCKCDFVFCSSHRYPKEHHCTYDHASVTRDKLTKQNPLIQAAKLDKI